MGSLLRNAIAVLAAGLMSAAALAQDVYYGQLDLYSLEVPWGWTVLPEGSLQSDVAIASPGGVGRGSIQVVLADPGPSLEDDAAYALGGSLITQQQPVEVDGFPCLYIASTGPRGEGSNTVFCTFTVPFEDGPSEVGIMISQNMHPDEIASQEPVFWQVVDSVRFHELLY